MRFSNIFAIGFCQPQNDRTKNGSRRSKNISLSASCPREGKRTFFQNSKKNVYTPFVFWLLSEVRTHAHQESRGTSPRLVFPVECTNKSQICLKNTYPEAKSSTRNIKLHGFDDFDDCGDLHAPAQTGWDWPLPELQKMRFSNTFTIGFCQPQNDRTKNGPRRFKNTSLSVSCPREGKMHFFQNSKKNVYTPL